ncbi:MAG: protein translocase subunit SecF, partial [Candidatus Magasanikbacteria bacterium]|nr:protein translocase subunit SecF [Candidatus Magasanikbacteria bacterium]
VVALLHDVFIPAGIFAALGHFYNYEVDTLFVTALLTILGFSVHDTIVTFDRVREHLKGSPKADFSALVDQSISETIGRSINTSMTVLLVLLAVYFFGGESVKQFNLVLIIGVIFGTYSSIFIACPLLVVWNKLARD